MALRDVKPIDADAQRSFRIWAHDDQTVTPNYWTPYGTTFAELFGYFDANMDRYVPPYGPADYVGKVFAFNTIDDNMGVNAGLLGYADDNWTDGTQSYVFAFDTAGDRDLGYGFSTTAVHEFGHHIGMSHPHDGYDAEAGLDFDAVDATYFAWSGDESNTIMAVQRRLHQLRPVRPRQHVSLRVRRLLEPGGQPPSTTSRPIRTTARWRACRPRPGSSAARRQGVP